MAINFLNNPKVGDNVKIEIGSSSDLQIYHDGGHSYITNSTGDLTISNTGDDLLLKSADDFLLYVQGTELAIQAVGNGGVILRHNNVAKFETTSTGVEVTGGIVFGDNHFIGNGSGDNLSIQSSTGEAIVLDSSSDIVLDAGGNDISLQAAGTEFGKLSKGGGSDFVINSSINDKDIIFTGLDGGSAITALTLDMSDAGAAEFGARLYIPDYIAHVGDSNTLFGFNGNDTFVVNTSGSERMRIVSGGNVGIGVTAPDNKLQVDGAVHITSALSNPTTNISGLILDYSGGNSRFFARGTATNTKGTFQFFSISSTNSGQTTQATIKSDGQLQLNQYGGSGQTGTAAFNLSVDSSGNVIQTANPSTGGGTVTGSGTATRLAFWVNNNSSGVSTELSSDSALYWDNTNNRLGVGTNTPSDRVTVDGDIRLLSGNKLILNRANNGTRSEINTDTTGKIILNSLNSEGIAVQNAGSTVLTVTSAGRLGIGTTSPLFKLQVEGTPPATNGALINIRNSAATTTNTTFGGIYFNSAPGNDFSIGKSNVNSVTTLSFRNGNTGASLIDVSPSGNVGIGTNNPTSRLVLVGAAAADSTIALANTTSSAYWQIQASSSANNLLLIGGGNVGIGTTTPINKLGIGVAANSNTKAINIYSGNTAVNSYTSIGSQYSTTNAYVESEIRFGNETLNGGGSYLGFVTGGTNTGNPERMRITSGGNVGVGTTSPSSKLHVADSSGGAAIKVAGTITDTSVYYYGVMHDATDMQGTTQVNTFYSGGSIKANKTITDYAGIRIDTPNVSATGAVVTNNYGVYQSSSLQKNYFAGNVGIGTNSPTAKLHVNNDNDYAAKFGGTGGGGDYSIEIGQGGTNSSPGFNAVAGSMLFKIADTEAMRINSSRNVGIGTTSPSYLLHIQSTTTGLTSNLKLNKNSTTGDYAEIAFQLWSGAGASLNTFGGNGTSRPSVVLRAINENANSAAGAFVVATFEGGATNSTLTEKFRINSTGNVGIGTTSPNSFSGQKHLTINGTDNSGVHLQVAGSDKGEISTSAGALYLVHKTGDIRLDAGGQLRMIVDSNGNVGIGNTSPQQRLHITNTSGSFGAEVVLRGSTSAGTPKSEIAFKRFTSGDGATMVLRTSNSSGTIQDVLTLDTSKNATFAGDVTLLEDLYASNQNLKFHAGGTHVMNIDTNGKVYPAAHNSYDIGHSTSLAWRNIYSSGTIFGTTATFADITVSKATPVIIIKDSNATTPSNTIGYVSMRKADDTEVAFMGMGSGSNSHLYLAGAAGTDVMIRTNATTAMFIDTNQRVGIGTTAPVTALDVRGEVSVAYNATYGLRFYNNARNNWSSIGNNVASGTAANLVFKDSTGEVMRITGGEVGIGTTSPASKLHVVANDSTIAQFASSGGLANDKVLQIQSGGDRVILDFKTNSTGAAADLAFESGNTERMRIDSGGDVGIGTIPETAGSTWRSLFVGSSLAFISRQSTTGTDSILANNYYINSSNVDKKRVTGKSSRLFLDSDVIRFQNSGTANADTTITWSERMRIDGNGDVGIGTTDPVPKLHLVYPNGSYGVDATSGFINQASSGRSTTRLRSIADTASELFFDVNGAARWDISARGSGSSYNLNFYPGASTPAYSAVGAHSLELQQNGNVVVTGSGSSGNMGIGTTAPSERLEVNGLIKSRKGIYNDKGVYTSGGTHTNKWQKFATASYSAFDYSAFKLLIQIKGDTSNINTNAEVDISYKFQNNNGKLYANIRNYGSHPLTSSNFEIYRNGTSSSGTLSFYIYIDRNYSEPVYSVIGTGNLTFSSSVIGTSLSGETNDAWTSKVISNTLTIDADSGYVGIGTTSPAVELEVAGIIRSAHAAQRYAALESNSSGGVVKGVGGNGFLVRSYGDSYFNGGDFGIGTTSPDEKLHIASSNKTKDGILEGTNNILLEDSNATGSSVGEPIGGILFKQNDQTTAAGVTAFMGAVHASTDGDANLTFATGVAGSEPTERMTVRYDGNVGIGTTNASSTLTILGANSAAGGITLTSSTSNSTQKVGRIKTQHYNTAEEPFTAIITNAQSTANVVNIGGSSGAENAATIIKLFTAANNTTLTGTERMRIASDGKVGIGTNNPSSLLHLSSASSPTLRIVDTTNSVTLLAYSQDSNANIGTGSAHQLQFFTNNSTAMVVNGSQDVGIGLTADVGKLGSVQFGGVRLHIRGSGNIGRSVLEGTVQATVLMRVSGNTASANAKIKFIQSKGGEYRMGSVDDNGTERTQLSIENNGDTHIEDGSLEVDTADKGLILKSANGNRFRITVDNGGTLTSTQIG